MCLLRRTLICIGDVYIYTHRGREDPFLSEHVSPGVSKGETRVEPRGVPMMRAPTTAVSPKLNYHLAGRGVYTLPRPTRPHVPFSAREKILLFIVGMEILGGAGGMGDRSCLPDVIFPRGIIPNRSCRTGCRRVKITYVPGILGYQRRYRNLRILPVVCCSPPRRRRRRGNFNFQGIDWPRTRLQTKEEEEEAEELILLPPPSLSLLPLPQFNRTYCILNVFPFSRSLSSRPSGFFLGAPLVRG